MDIPYMSGLLDLKYNRWRWDIPDVGCACA
jgi:hypothetical protein